MSALSATWRWPLGAAVWLLAWLGLAALDGRLDLTNLAVLLVAGASLAAPALPLPASLLAGAASVLAFNWLFVPPRGSFSVDSAQHLWLLGSLLLVCWLSAALSHALLRQLGLARAWAARAEVLRDWVARSRDADDPLVLAGQLQSLLGQTAEGSCTLWLLRGAPHHPGQPLPGGAETLLRLGEADDEEAAALAHCLTQGEAMGPGTGRHQQLGQWYLPLRGRAVVLGAALLRGEAVWRVDEDSRRQAQALCDQLGLAMARRQHHEAEAQAREQARTVQTRNALLAAVSHDYRTPLATIIGAADSLIDQAPQLSAEQRRTLAQTVRDQATQLARLTDNTLQLARLEAPDVALRLDWESPEELIGAALQRARQREAEGQWRARGSDSRLRARVEPGLPMLRCDAVLLAQLLDNLVDNALAYSTAPSPVELLARQQGPHLLLAVRDRGPGVPPGLREQLFQAWTRGPEADRVARGSGVGLAVCLAIARAHGGELLLRRRTHGGSAFECRLPLGDGPPAPLPEAAA